MRRSLQWVAAGLVGTVAAGGIANSQQIWLAAVDPYTSEARKWNASVDYMDLFRPDAPWKTVASRASVFKLGPAFSRVGKDEQLRLVIEDLRRRNIALALEVGLLPYPGSCSKADEAHGPPDRLEQLLARVKSLGGSPQFIAMDEPATYGLRPLPDGTCSESASDVAEQLKPSIELVRRYFPDAKIGTIEVVDASRERTANVVNFISAYQKVVGTPLAFLHVDMSWSSEALKNLSTVAQLAKNDSIPIGVIYNGPPESDAAWTAGAQHHVDQVETGLGLKPDAAIFQTWNRYPSHLLPETRPGTLTNVVLGYLRPSPRITLQRTENRVVGRLTDNSGKPIAKATVTVTAHDVRGLSSLQSKEIRGTVPADARSALIGVRIDVEGVCACSGDVDAKIGAVEYRDDQVSHRVLFPGSVHNVREFRTSRGKPVMINSQPFPVTPGAGYSVAVQATTTEQSEAAGYVAVIFLGEDKKGLQRQMWYFRPNEESVGTVTTDDEGRFASPIPPNIAHLGAKISVHYNGDSERRGAISTPQ